MGFARATDIRWELSIPQIMTQPRIATASNTSHLFTGECCRCACWRDFFLWRMSVHARAYARAQPIWLCRFTGSTTVKVYSAEKQELRYFRGHG